MPNRTPGLLNPLSFDTEEEFRAALEAQGKEHGFVHSDEPLEHHGTKGMRWGVRKDKGSGGVLRRQASRQTQKQIDLHKKALNNKGLLGKAALLDKHTWGRDGNFEKYHNQKISELERSKERVDRGEMVARTLLFGPQYSKKK